MTDIHATHEPNILIVDDDAGAIQVLGRMLAGFGRLRFAMRGEHALNLAREAVPDLMLLDEGMPGLSGFDICRAMKADPALVHVPVIFITSFGQPDFEVQALRLGAVDFIVKPLVGEHVQARVRARLRDSAMLRRARSGSEVVWIPAAAPTRALVVDADPDAAQETRVALEPMAASVQLASRGTDALRVMAAESINLVLLDAQLPDIDGFEVLQRIRSDAALRHIAVVFVTRPTDAASEARALDLGAADFIAKPYVATVLQARVRGVLRVQRHADAAQRAQREQWQRLGESRVADIVAAAADAIVSLDATGHIVLINAAACRLLGVTPEQALGAAAQQRVPFIDTLLARAAADPAALDHETLVLVQADGRSSAVEASLSCVGEGAEQITTLMLRDVTQRSRLVRACADTGGHRPPESRA